MGYYEYYLIPRPGFTIEEACEQTSERTAEIAEYRGGLPTGLFLSASNSNRQKFHPKFSPVYYARKQKVVTNTAVKVIEKPLYEEKLASEANPYFQLILIGINRAEKPSEGKFGLSEEELIRYLIMELRVFPFTREAIRDIQMILRYMSDLGLLINKNEQWARGMTLKAGDMMIDWRQGYDPLEDNLLNFIKDTGLTTKNECNQYITQYCGWKFTNLDIVDYKLMSLHKKGCIAVEGRNWFYYVKALEPFVVKESKKLLGFLEK